MEQQTKMDKTQKKNVFTSLYKKGVDKPLPSMSIIFFLLTGATCLIYSFQLIDIGMFISLIIGIISSIFTFGALLVSAKAMKKSEEATTKSLNATMIQIRLETIQFVSNFINSSFFITAPQRIIEYCLPRDEKLTKDFLLKFENAMPKSFMLFTKYDSEVISFREKHQSFRSFLDNSFDISHNEPIKNFFWSITYIHGIDQERLSSLKKGSALWEQNSASTKALEMAKEIVFLGMQVISRKIELEKLLENEFKEYFPTNNKGESNE